MSLHLLYYGTIIIEYSYNSVILFTFCRNEFLPIMIADFPSSFRVCSIIIILIPRAPQVKIRSYRQNPFVDGPLYIIKQGRTYRWGFRGGDIPPVVRNRMFSGNLIRFCGANVASTKASYVIVFAFTPITFVKTPRIGDENYGRGFILTSLFYTKVCLHAAICRLLFALWRMQSSEHA